MIEAMKNQSGERQDSHRSQNGHARFRREDSDMIKYAPKLLTVIVLALAATLFLPQRAAADDDDPPTRVARLSYTHGAVSFQPPGSHDWVSTPSNRPFTTVSQLCMSN